VPLPDDSTYVAGLGAVLFVAVGRGPGDAEPVLVHEAVRAVVRRAGGVTEALASGDLLAGFPDAATALGAALAIPPEVAAGELPVPVRIGVHAAPVLVTPEGHALAAAADVARSLASAARPGTICISDAVRRAAGERLDVAIEDLGTLRVGDGNTEVHAYLIVPPAVASGPRLPRRAVIGGIAVAAALGGAGVLAIATRWRVGAKRELLTIGVMQFKGQSDDVRSVLVCDAVRDGLNTQLSELSVLKAYSREFLDFLVTRQGLTEIEAAAKLGIEKMLTGRVDVTGTDVRVATQIVDVQSGVIEAAYTTSGRVDDLLTLQSEVVEGAIDKLGLTLTPDDQSRLASRRASNLGALRRLREAEGNLPPPAPPTAPVDRPTAPPDPSSWLGPRAAWADGEATERAEIEALLERYRQATEARDMTALAAMYDRFGAEQRTALERYFAGVKDLHVKFENLDLAVVGDEAVVSYLRVDDFVDVELLRPMHVATRITRVLRRTDGAWRFTAAK
jgi:TolB-like protein/ketosteroid isomerase-like protein